MHLDEDGKFRERAYQRLYQLYGELSEGMRGHARSINHLIAIEPLDKTELKNRLEAFNHPSRWEPYGIISGRSLIEIRTLETALFGKTSLP